MINEIQFQPLGYILVKSEQYEGLKVSQNKDKWPAIAKSLVEKGPLSEVDFSKKDVLLISQVVDHEVEWLIVDKIQELASDRLKIECSLVIVDSYGFACPVKCLQFIAIDKRPSAPKITVDKLKEKKGPSDLDTELSSLQDKIKELETKKYTEKSKKSDTRLTKLRTQFERQEEEVSNNRRGPDLRK